MCWFRVQFCLLVTSIYRRSLEGTKKILRLLLQQSTWYTGRHSTPRHVQNSHAMLSRQPNVILLYVLATAFANHESLHVKLHTYGNNYRTLLKKVYNNAGPLGPWQIFASDVWIPVLSWDVSSHLEEWSGVVLVVVIWLLLWVLRDLAPSNHPLCSCR